MLTFDYDRAELYEVGWRLRRLSRPCRFIDRSLFVGLPVITLAVLWTRMTSDPILWLAYIAALIAWCVVAPWLHHRFSALCIVLVMLDRYHCFPRSGHVKVKIAPDGITWNSTHSDRFATWPSVKRIVMDVDYVYIQINFRTYNWIPRRLFRTDSEWTTFTAQVEDFAYKAGVRKPIRVSMNAQAVA